jgi:hypothetical protein
MALKITALNKGMARLSPERKKSISSSGKLSK